MNVFDWIVLAILIASLFYGYKVGLVDGVVTVIAIYVSLLIGGQFAGRVLSLLPLSVENEALSTPIGYVIIFAAVLFASRIVASAANATLEKISVVEWVNKAGGLLFGVVIWVLLAGAVMTVTARYTYVFDEPQQRRKSKPYGVVRELVASDVRTNHRRHAHRIRNSSHMLLEFRGVTPGGMLGMAPADFDTALDILEERASR